jgi:3-deoxy-D-manno-octulosonic-acid transferase
MHAPSVGEGLQARPVIERIRERHPHVQIVYTHFSPSAERFAAALAVDHADYLPFDSARAMRRVLDALRPTALVCAKLDLWPQLTAAAADRGVRLGLISATLGEGSSRRGPLARALSLEAFGALDAVGAVDVDDAERLISAGVRPDRIRVTGDTRYDQVAARAAAVDRSGPILGPLDSGRPTLVAGSSWPADDAVFFDAWLRVLRDVPAARLIIAPHELTPDHLQAVRDWAALSGLSLGALGTPDAREADVVLVDRMGVLGDLYALADAAYVGGGFHAAGLHSVLEPAAFGTPVVFGPRFSNSRDARLLLAAHAAATARDVPTLAAALSIPLAEHDTRRAAGVAARRVVESGLGAADRSTTLVEQLLGLA